MRRALLISVLATLLLPVSAWAQFRPRPGLALPQFPPTIGAPMTAAPTTDVGLTLSLGPVSMSTGLQVARHTTDVFGWDMNAEATMIGEDTDLTFAVAGRARKRRGAHPEAGSVFATLGLLATAAHPKVWSPLIGVGMQSDYRDGLALRVDMQRLPRLCSKCTRLAVGASIGF